MTEDDVRELIRQRFPGVGGQLKLARRAGISPAYVSQFMTGLKGPGPAILEELGVLKRIKIYYELASCANEKEGA